MSRSLAQVLPHDVDAETNVLSAMMLAPSAVTTCSELLQPDDFYFASNGLIFQTMIEMDQAGIGVDAVTLAAELERRNLLHRVNGRGHIHEIASSGLASANAKHWASIVNDTATLRRLNRAGQEIVKLSLDRDSRFADVRERVGEAESLLAKLTDGVLGGDVELLPTTIAELTAAIKEAYLTGHPRLGLPTGMRDLDALTFGLHAGQLIVVGARPSMGKSVFGLNVVENVAGAGVGPAALFSYEMPKEELAARSMSRITGIPSLKLLAGQLTPPEWSKVETAERVLSELPLFVDDRSGSLTELRARIVRLKRRHDVKVVVVDYLQLIPVRGDQPRHEKVAEVSRSLKMLARELEMPIIAIAQLNRELERREVKRPQLSDLRESGALEQDADVVIFIHREDYYNPDTPDKGIAEIIVAKQRMGERDTVRMAFAKQSSAFRDLTKQLDGG